MHNLSSAKRHVFSLCKQKQSNSVCVLKDFSNQLQLQLKQIKYIHRKDKKNNSLHNDMKLPKINHRAKNKNNQNIDDKLYQIEEKIIRMEKDCQQFNNNIKLKNAFQSINDSNQNTYRSTYSISKEKRFTCHPPIYQPLIIYPTTIISNRMPNFPYNFNVPNSNPFINAQNGNKTHGANYFNQSQTSIESNHIPAPRKAFLKRKFRVIALAVLFIFLYKTYSRSITYQKCLKFKQIQNTFGQHQTIQADIMSKVLKFRIYDTFFDICKKVQLKTKNQGYQVEIPYQDQDMVINIKACQRFLLTFLDHIYAVINENQFQQLNLINVQFLAGSFPLSNMFLKQQLKLINFSQNSCLKVTPQMSKMLIINYFFIKIILYRFLCKKHLMTILKRAFHKKYTQKKFILLYGKKLVVSLVLLYQALNSIFFNNIKKKSNTYEILAPNLKPSPMKQIKYNFSISYYKVMQNEKHLIKKINSSIDLVSAFMELFQQNWDKIKKITQLLYSRALKQQKNSMEQIKQIVMNKPFPNRQQLRQFLKKKTNKKYDEISDSSSDNEQSEASKSNKSVSTKKLGTKKKIKNKK